MKNNSERLPEGARNSQLDEAYMELELANLQMRLERPSILAPIEEQLGWLVQISQLHGQAMQLAELSQ